MTTIMRPLQCDLQPQIQETHWTTHIVRPERPQPQPPHTHTRYLSSPLAATLHGKMQGFVLRLPPQHKRHHFPSSPLPFLTTSLRHHFPRSPLPFVTTLCHSLLFFCDVLLCDVKSHTALHQCQVSQFYLSVTRKFCFPTSFDKL